MPAATRLAAPMSRRTVLDVPIGLLGGVGGPRVLAWAKAWGGDQWRERGRRDRGRERLGVGVSCEGGRRGGRGGGRRGVGDNLG